MATVHHGGLSPATPPAIYIRWSVAPGVEWKAWGEEVVARSETTGKTYLLSFAAGEALKALHTGAHYVDEVVTRLFAEDPRPGGASASLVAKFSGGDAERRALHGILEDLESLGLVKSERA